MESITFVLDEKAKLHTQPRLIHRHTFLIFYRYASLRKVKNGLIAFNYVRRAFYELTEEIVFFFDRAFLAYHLHCASFFSLFILFVSFAFVIAIVMKQRAAAKECKINCWLFVFQMTVALKWKAFVWAGSLLTHKNSFFLRSSRIVIHVPVQPIKKLKKCGHTENWNM